MKKYFFCGIGGAGMSPLARLLAARGELVVGSDRSYDSGRNKPFFNQLRDEGITLVPQDGSGVDTSIDTFVVTRAVEDSIPDVRRAKDLSVKILKRPFLMAEIFTSTQNIAVGGTSGKSTTTGMIGHILTTHGLAPTIVNGAIMRNFESNMVVGTGNIAVFEADESDGLNDVITVCPADVVVLTNISLDHFELDTLGTIFGGAVESAKRGAVINADCENSVKIAHRHRAVKTFGAARGDFSEMNCPVQLNIPGKHNRANALAAIAACSFFGISKEKSIEALKTFRGTARRLDVIGTVNDIKIVDDFASNPGKIAASIQTLQESSKRLIVIFQPHGFQPTKMMKQGYIDTFTSLLRKDDILIMPQIYYAGGTGNVVDGKIVALPTDISSRDVVEPIKAAGRDARYIPERSEILSVLQNELRPFDTVTVMGSRDETLSDFAREIQSILVRPTRE